MARQTPLPGHAKPIFFGTGILRLLINATKSDIRWVEDMTEVKGH